MGMGCVTGRGRADSDGIRTWGACFGGSDGRYWGGATSAADVEIMGMGCVGADRGLPSWVGTNSVEGVVVMRVG